MSNAVVKRIPRPAAEGTSHSRLAAELDALTPREGQQASPVEGVTLWRLNRSVPRVPVLYEPCVAFVVQGNKRGFLGDRTFIYSPNSYLVLTIRRKFDPIRRLGWVPRNGAPGRRERCGWGASGFAGELSDVVRRR